MEGIEEEKSSDEEEEEEEYTKANVSRHPQFKPQISNNRSLFIRFSKARRTGLHLVVGIIIKSASFTKSKQYDKIHSRGKNTSEAEVLKILISTRADSIFTTNSITKGKDPKDFLRMTDLNREVSIM